MGALATRVASFKNDQSALIVSTVILSLVYMQIEDAINSDSRTISSADKSECFTNALAAAIA